MNSVIVSAFAALQSFKRFNIVSFTVLVVSLAPSVVFAKGAGTSGGLTLMEPFGARPAALGEAFSAVTNDIAAFGYNPASLRSLSSGQASFMYEKGIAGDTFGHFMVGTPQRMGTLGISLGYYNGGDMMIFDGVNERNVTAQTDLTLSLGYGLKVGRMSVGATGKYLSSELAETAKATAFAADLGMQMPVSPRVLVGAALQNFGTKLTFISEGDSLPRIARAGAAFVVKPGRNQTSLLVDVPYYLNERETRPALGIETLVGPLALRLGYRTGNNLEELSIGTGFVLGKSTLDYSFGLVDQLDSRHRVSFSMKFGAGSAGGQMMSQPKAVKPPTALGWSQTTKVPKYSYVDPSSEPKKATTKAEAGSVYTVKPGDTLGKIAKRVYGDVRLWKKIYAANDHMIDADPRGLAIGQRLILPK